jgi:hypothetical protein
MTTINTEVPQFNGVKGDKYMLWKMKFEANQEMKGLREAFLPDFERELQENETADLNLTSSEGKKQKDALAKNNKMMMQLALAFTTVSLANKFNCEKCRGKANWPTEKAHRVMTVIIKEFEPEDTMAEMEMERALSKKLGPKKDPLVLLNEFASIECRYSLDLSDARKKSQVLRLGGNAYAGVMITMNMIYREKGKPLTTETLLEEMHLQYRLTA